MVGYHAESGVQIIWPVMRASMYERLNTRARGIAPTSCARELNSLAQSGFPRLRAGSLRSTSVYSGLVLLPPGP